MKTKVTIVSAILLGLCALVFLREQMPLRKRDPEVQRIVGGLRQTQSQDALPAGPATAKRRAVKSSLHHYGAASPSVLADAVAVSSFFLPSELAGLSNEQLAQLEVVLSEARKATYELLLNRGQVSVRPGGQVEIVIPAQGAALAEMKSYVRGSIRDIVGDENMKALEHSLGPKFDAKFAYFGKYDTTIELSFDGKTAAGDRPAYVTMRNNYATGQIKSTHVLKVDTFEADFFRLEAVKPRT